MNIMEFNKLFGAATAALLIYLLANYFSGELYTVQKPKQLAYALEIESDEAESGEAAAEAEGSGGGGVQLASLLQEASAEDGEKTFRKCAACHKVAEGQNAVGPSLWNVVGRPVQSIDGFNYSGALAETGAEVWSFENLFNFIKNPKEWAPGTSMGYAGLEDPEDRADVLVYLNQAGDDPQPLPEPEAAPEPEPAPAEESAEAAPAEEPAEETEMAAMEPEASPAEDAAPAEEAAEAAPVEPAPEEAAGAEAQDATEAAVAEAEESMPEGVEPVAEPAPMTFDAALGVVSPAEGEQVFQQCAACHRLGEGEHGIAPSLYGIVGREVAAAPYFPYSDALQSLGGEWTPARLNAYLSDPAAYAPGNHMAFHGLDDARDRAAVVTFLNTVGGDSIDLAAASTDEAPATEALTDASEAAGDVVEAAEETAVAAAEAVEETAAEAADAVEEGAAEAAEAVTEAAEETVAAAEEAVDETGEAPAPTEETAAAEESAPAEEPATAEAEPAPAAEETEMAALAEEEAPAAAEEAAPAAAGGGDGVMAGLSPDFAAALASASADDGEGVFRKCAACHKLDEGKHAVGPSLHGVIGRPIGSADGFRYSDVIGGMDGEWTYAKLNAFLEAPRKWAKGTKMAFAGLRDIEDRAAVVKYLNEADGSPEPMPE